MKFKNDQKYLDSLEYKRFSKKELEEELQEKFNLKSKLKIKDSKKYNISDHCFSMKIDEEKEFEIHHLRIPNDDFDDFLITFACVNDHYN